MKKIGNILDKKRFATHTTIDQESVFYIFKQVIAEEYGRQGSENIKPALLKDKKIFVKATGSTWPSEVWLQRKQIVKKINNRLGGEEISDLSMSN